MSSNPKFSNENYYHLYNRGVAKQPIFSNKSDYQHLLTTFRFYLEKEPSGKLSQADAEMLKAIFDQDPNNPQVVVLAYCLMPNHFHLLVKQLTEGGITSFMRHSLDSYTRYFNVKYDRVGTLFQGSFRAQLVENDNQLIHLSRYIHLNPFMSGLINKVQDYEWSSYKTYIVGKVGLVGDTKMILDFFNSPNKYKEFVEDYADYAKTYHQLQNLTLE